MKPTVPLGYGRTYTLTVASRGPNGVAAEHVSSFATLRPSNQTKVSLTTTSEAPLREGGTYGVGTVIVAHFDEQIVDRAAAERQLAVTTDPAVAGSWFWVDDQNAHWRPEHYYAPDTTVTVEAKIYGIALGNGIFGQEDNRVSFRIGGSHIAIADDATKLVSVFDNGALVRTMPTSMGMGGTETVGGRTLSFWTPRHLYRARQGQPGGDGLVDLRAAQEFPPRISRDHQLRHPDQHRRHLSASARRDGVGSGPYRYFARMLEPQRRQCEMVLRLRRTR
ncbi:hypothetical protein NIIDMKKI_32610 [Mycobacterium kansasii]|uniref:Bacterial Ig domain-containing protein n=1 Tax=Mycobacterium kansasii TaxID=1768 RepID=A0A7G1IE65_MYCKA|nr:hypothetical protein NIIDMKKI_32610 [Mycobacterium kansasii]